MLTVPQHSQVHKPVKVYCFGECGQTFISYSAMLLHLEPGACPCSPITARDIRWIAGSDCKSMARFAYWNGERTRFRCECEICGAKFSAMSSSLMQHAETRACSEDPDDPQSPLYAFLGELYYRIGKYYHYY